MNEHALDAMIYAWMVMKEKEESSMEGIFLGQAVDGVFSIDKTKLTFEHERRTNESHSAIRYSDCDYVLVESDDVIKTNDELLKLRDKVKRLTNECTDWKTRYSKANNELFQKGLAYGTLEGVYKNEKIAGELLLKDRDALKEKVDKLEAELTEIKTTRTLREAYIAGVEKGCESLREERDRWKNRCNSVMTDIAKSLEANGIEFTLKEVHGNGNWDVVIDIPELNEAKKKVEDLEKKLAAAKSNETYWRDRKEEEEDYHHYWLHTFDRAVKQAADKGIHIDVRGTDEECNAGVVVVDNVKAEELKKRVVALEKTNNNLNQKIGAVDNALEYWNNTYNDIVIAGKKVGVKIDIKGKRSDSNAGFVYVTNEKAIELMVKVSDTKHWYSKKWQAMLDTLKDKGIEVIYMGEQDGKPIIDIKVPGWDDDKKWVNTFAKDCADFRADKFRLERERDELKEQCDILRKDFVTRGQELEDLRKENQNLGDSYSKLKKDFEALNASYINRGSRIECLELDLKDNKYKDNKYEKLFKHACDMKDYWYSTYYEAVRQSWSQGVSIRIDKVNFKDNVGIVQVNNERAEELKREIEELKSNKVSTCTLEAGADGRLKFIYKYMDGHNESANVDYLCKNLVDADSISHGTIPKCSSCAHYMHNPSRFAHDWCYMPIPKEGGAGYIRKLNKEEAEGPACSDFKARKE